jgi:hypothetical protein
MKQRTANFNQLSITNFNQLSITNFDPEKIPKAPRLPEVSAKQNRRTM